MLDFVLKKIDIPSFCSRFLRINFDFEILPRSDSVMDCGLVLGSEGNLSMEGLGCINRRSYKVEEWLMEAPVSKPEGQDMGHSR